MRQFAIGKLEPGARALEEGLGNEEAKAHADTVGGIFSKRLVGARGDERLAKLLQYVWREARAVVGDDDPHLVLGPARGDIDLALGEVDCVLNEIAEAVKDTRITLGDRFK